MLAKTSVALFRNCDKLIKNRNIIRRRVYQDRDKMQIDIESSFSSLADLVKKAASGMDVVLEENGKPVARIVPIHNNPDGLFQFGCLPDLKIKDDFDAPLPEDIAESFGANVR